MFPTIKTGVNLVILALRKKATHASRTMKTRVTAVRKMARVGGNNHVSVGTTNKKLGIWVIFPR